MAATASFQYGAEEPQEFTITPGESVKSAWERVGRDIGANTSRPVTFKAGGALISGNATPQPGQVIIASVNLEDKG